jgi:hypothetical protein
VIEDTCGCDLNHSSLVAVAATTVGGSRTRPALLDDIKIADFHHVQIKLWFEVMPITAGNSLPLFS